MSNNSPRITLEGSFSHAEFRSLQEQYPTLSLTVSSSEGHARHDRLDMTYTANNGEVLNPSWYELYPLESGEVLPLVTKSLLRRGHNELYGRDSDVPSRAWNAVEHHANRLGRPSISGQTDIADYVRTLQGKEKYGSRVVTRQQLIGFRADRLGEFVDRADDLDIYNMQGSRTKSRKLIAAYTQRLLTVNPE